MSDAQVEAVLEARYRRLLSFYPKEWRTRNEDAVLGVLLDLAEGSGRTAPTARETFDLTLRGLTARTTSTVSDDLRRRVAGLSAGLGLGFAAVYFALFIGPSGFGDYVPVAHAGPAAILLTWLVVTVAVFRGRDSRWRLAAIAAAAFVPVLLWLTRSLVDVGNVLVVTGWARPSNATALFIAGLAALAALGPIDRRLMLRTAGIAAVCFAVGLWITGGWNDPYDQALWGSPDQSPFAAPGTLQMVWGSGSGRMPLARDAGPSADDLFRAWLQGTVLRLNMVPVAAVAAALLLSGVLMIRRRTQSGVTVLVLILPFLAALIACAAQGGGVWFQ